MHKLYTIGYEGCSVEQLIATLQNVKIKVLADVRELPLSRKKGLSKTALRDRLATVGIEYYHFRQLGDPKEGRDAAKAGNFSKFERVFLSHFHTSDTQDALEDLLKVARSKNSCMLCFERCAEVCHRSYIADEAAARGFEIYNLYADKAERYSENGIEIPRYYPRQSLTAAE